MQISDMEQYKQYMAAAPAAVAAAGGEYLVRGGKFEALEGQWNPKRVAMLRFPSYDKAKAFYDGEMYRQPAPSARVPPNFSIWSWSRVSAHQSDPAHLLKIHLFNPSESKP